MIDRVKPYEALLGTMSDANVARRAGVTRQAVSIRRRRLGIPVYRPEMPLERADLDIRPEELAELFHTTYERLAPLVGYRTREETAVPWEQVPDQSRRLMAATVAYVLLELRRRAKL